MSIQRIDHDGCSSHGYQVRVHVMKGHPRLTRFFADDAHGGQRRAHRLAKQTEPELQDLAYRPRRRLSRG